MSTPLEMHEAVCLEIQQCFKSTKKAVDAGMFMMVGDQVSTEQILAGFKSEGYRVEGNLVWAKRWKLG